MSRCRNNRWIRHIFLLYSLLTISLPVRGFGQSSTVSATTKSAAPSNERCLDFYGSLICGAISRSLAKVLLHPANTAKTLAQTKGRGQNRVIAEAALEGLYVAQSGSRVLTVPPSGGRKVVTAPQSLSPTTGSGLKILFRGAGAQFILSSFLGAANFAVLEQTRKAMDSERFRSIFAKTSQTQSSDQRENAVAGATKRFCCQHRRYISLLPIEHTTRCNYG